MAELAHFKNFAKLKDTSVEFNDITVLAGKPGTGKSYVMKFQYGINLSINKYMNDIKEISENKNLSNSSLAKKIIDNGHRPFEHAYESMLKSIFGNLNQISNTFSFESNMISLKYSNNRLEADSKIEGTEEELDNYVEKNDYLFVETPLILEFYQFLDDKLENRIPYHIHSLIESLRKPPIYAKTNLEQDNFIRLFIQKTVHIINGNIENNGNNFGYITTNNEKFDIVNASSGIKSIGLLQYLVSSKSLKKGSILFWEEPEVHLHPEWQLRMVELFIELMNAGIKIIFSTHSPYMCDYLNAISKKKDFSDRVSFNLFEENDGVVENHILKTQKDWNKIQAELLDPLEEIMWEYV